MQRRVLRTVLLPYSLPLYTTRSSSATLQEECFRFVFVGTLQGDTPVLIRETSRCCRGYHARDCVENLPLYSFRPRAARPARRASRFAMRCGVAEIMRLPLSTPPRPWQGVESRPQRRVNDGMSRRTARPTPNPRFAAASASPLPQRCSRGTPTCSGTRGDRDASRGSCSRLQLSSFRAHNP